MTARRNGLPESPQALYGSEGDLIQIEQPINEALTRFRLANTVLAHVVVENGPDSYQALRQQNILNQVALELAQSRK